MTLLRVSLSLKRNEGEHGGRRSLELDCGREEGSLQELGSVIFSNAVLGCLTKALDVNQIANIRWIIKKTKRVPEKYLLLL